MKRVFIIVPVVLILLIGGALVAPGFVDWSKYKPEAVAQIKKATGYDVALNGDIGLTVLPFPRVYIENVDVASPEGSKEDHLIRMKRLDVSLDMGSLLTGKVDFSSVKLIEPDIALEVFDDGRQNWMTPELQAMTKKDPNAPQQQTTQIALRDVTIEKGHFIYRAGKGAAPSEITDINVSLKADTLQGPFDVNGKITTAGQTIDLDAKTGKLLQDANSIQVNMQANVSPLDASVKYAGVIGLADPYDIQGETEITARNINDKLKGAPVKLNGDATIKGMITGSTKGADFKEATINIADNEFKGAISVTLSPVKLVTKLIGAKTINLDDIITADAGKKDPKAPNQILPATIELPAAFEADVQIAAPGLIYNKQTYKDVNVGLAKAGSTFTAAFAAAQIPGNGSINGNADLKFASKTNSKTGAEVYADPTMTGTIKAESQNIGQTAQALTGQNNPAFNAWKTGSLDGAFTITPDVITLSNKSTLRLNDMTMQIGAAYSPRGSRPAVALDVTADTLNFDDIQKKLGGDAAAKPAGNMQDTISALNFPMDIDFDVGVQNAILQGQKITGLRAQGTARQNSLKFTNLSAQNFAGAAFKMEGGVGDLKGLKGIDVKFSGQSDDVKGVAKMAGLDPATLPQQVDSASVSATLSGDISKLAVKADVKALSGEVIVSGDVADPLATMKISNMAVQIKHSNMAQALKIFAPSAPQYASWQKPVDIYAEIDTQGKLHNLRNIKGTLAGTTIAGTFSYDQTGTKPVMKGDLTFGDLVMISDASAAAAVANGASAPAAANGGGRWSSAPIDTSWMNAFDADLSIKAKSIAYETWSFQNPDLNFSLQNGALQIKRMEGGLYGGTFAINGLMSGGGKGPVAIDGNVKMNKVSVENLVTSLARGTKLIQGKGEVNMDTTIKSSGTSQQALISNLSGSGTTTGKDIVMDGFDLARFGAALSDENKPKDALLGLYKTSIKGGSTAFNTMDGDYTIRNGIVNIAKLDMDGPTAALATKGNINLPNWTIATEHSITLKEKKDVPPFTIKIAGSLDNPGQTFGQGLLQDYLNRKLEKKLQGAIADKLGGKAGGALGALLGVPQQQAAPVIAQPVTEPAAGDELNAAPATATPDANAVQPAPAEAQPAPQQMKPEEALQGVLKGLLNKH